MSEAARVRKVTMIPQRIQPLTQLPLHTVAKRKVAGYARVSTDSEEQENSYEAQVDYFTEYIKSNEAWEFVKVYTDEGISGVSTRRREGFNEMIADALAGKIELIVTKSVSRFARNTVDSLTTIRELKAHGVEVYFQKENIYTFDGKGELLLTIMSSLAQEESRSISENVTWGIRKSFSDGKVSMNYKSFLGYRRGEDDMPEIVPEEAEIVQTIYRRFLEGSTVHEIAKALTVAGVPTPMKRKTWSETTVQSILTNEKYMGDAILQKTFCADFLTKKMKKNEGELPQYHVRNSHPAIVSAEVFELVQMEIESRRRFGSRYSGRGVFASRIVCADCGGFYGSKVWHSNDPYRTVIWRCNRKYEKGMRCTTPHVKEEAIKTGFIQVMARLLASRQSVLEDCRRVLDEVLTTDEQSRQIAKLQDQAVGLAQRIRGLVNENARTQMTEDEFTPEYDRLVGQYEKLAASIATIQREKEDKEYRAKRISLFMRILAGQEECLEFDPAVFTAFVEKVVVSGTKKDIRLRFVLRDGSEYAIEGVTQTISHYRFVPQ
jgi:site-specific DNA recombinase